MRWFSIFAFAVILIISCSDITEHEHSATLPPPLKTADNRGDDAEIILGRYAAAWKGKQEDTGMQQTEVMTFWISGEGGGKYTIELPPEGPAKLAEGIAESFSGGFRTDIETLRRLDRGEISAMTAMGRANWNDPADMDPVFPAGSRLTPQLQARLLPLAFHFWNREWPETIRFGEGTTRFVHGGNAAIFFYDKGMRTGWYQLREGMHINDDPSDQTNPFPSLFIVTRGKFQGKLDGKAVALQEGLAVHVPAGMTHEFWADKGEYGEFILIMWGEGA